MEELRVIVFKHNSIVDDSKLPTVSQEGKTEEILQLKYDIVSL